ncbi:MAG: DUF4232 domain-containing protein [Streptosporangiaceae bacterium]
MTFAAAALAGLAMVAGCSSSSSSSQPATSGSTAAGSTTPAAVASSSSGNTPAATSSSSPAAAGPAPCATSSLHVKQGLAQGYAGGVYEVIDFTNISTATCTLYGYPGVSLVTGAPYSQVGLAAKRTTGTVKQIKLAPGATANALLQIVDALNYPPATCGPTKATALKVYPPNQTAPVYLASTGTTGCAKPVAIMNIGPVQAGSGGSA